MLGQVVGWQSLFPGLRGAGHLEHTEQGLVSTFRSSVLVQAHAVLGMV